MCIVALQGREVLPRIGNADGLVIVDHFAQRHGRTGQRFTYVLLKPFRRLVTVNVPLRCAEIRME
jgi:hypothetical protein